MEYYLAIKKKEILPFATTWMELEGIMLSEISPSEKDKYHMFSLMWNLRNFTEDHGGREGKKVVTEREANHKRLLNTENKLRVDGRGGGEGKWVMGIEEGTCWVEHWVLYLSSESWESTLKTKSTQYTLYVSQLDNKLYLKKMFILREKEREREQGRGRERGRGNPSTGLDLTNREI